MVYVETDIHSYIIYDYIYMAREKLEYWFYEHFDKKWKQF